MIYCRCVSHNVIDAGCCRGFEMALLSNRCDLIIAGGGGGGGGVSLSFMGPPITWQPFAPIKSSISY